MFMRFAPLIIAGVIGTEIVSSTEHLSLAGILAAVVAVTEMLRAFFEWAKKKIWGEKQRVVKLDRETASDIHETKNTIKNVYDIVSLRDQNGTPHVYAPRGADSETLVVLERVANVLERIENRLNRE